MKRLMGAFLAVSAIAAIEVLTGVPATPAQACTLANFKNLADSCPPGTTYGRGNVDDEIAEPASAPPEDVVAESA